ncbi:22.0 kDa class IV heat shock protein-like [Heracleum sosnowskyi]|uniref:22.0 kDa class IV heat shock protein-like n=1 Tax=Heracleum sosnowskyi TaxID=360622 RepID=A0AAD8JDM7_9APIA|nr:22.0 kDa class IV heat shock protein-like [Heracleum sosnowskyi]
MAITKSFPVTLLILTSLATALPLQTEALTPYSGKSLLDMLMLPMEDPFRILEQTPMTIPKGVVESVAMARADWKETSTAHMISLDIPGMKKEDVKIEVEENRVLRVSGELRAEEEIEGEKWHRAERTSGKFWRQFRLPGNANLDKVSANLEHGVLKIVVPKLAEEKKKEPRVISIAEESGGSGESIKTSKAEL